MPTSNGANVTDPCPLSNGKFTHVVRAGDKSTWSRCLYCDTILWGFEIIPEEEELELP